MYMEYMYIRASVVNMSMLSPGPRTPPCTYEVWFDVAFRYLLGLVLLDVSRSYVDVEIGGGV